MNDCDYCYGTMGKCPVCGPFYYAESEVIGGQREAGYHVDGWALTGCGLDWTDRANARGRCWRATDELLNTFYAMGDKLAEIAFKPSGLAIALEAARAPR